MRRFSIVLSVLSVAALCSVAAAHQATYFFPQVPDPGKMVTDGQDDDWGWYDEQFTITPNDLFDIFGGAWPAGREDWDVTLRVAWSAPPDNCLYYFARVTDDSLGLFWDDPNNWWQDDALEIIVDADHSSEDYTMTFLTTGQQYCVRILPWDDPAGTWLYNSSEPMRWSTREPYFIFRWTLDPPDAKPYEQPVGRPVTYTYEVKQWIWDFHDEEGPAGSKRHFFAPDQTIGLTFQFDEAENPEVKREKQLNTTPVDGAYYDNSFGSDFITLGLPGADSETAVHATTWGRIKASFQAGQ